MACYNNCGGGCGACGGPSVAVQETPTLDLDVTCTTPQTLSGTVKVSAYPYNQLLAAPDGLFVPAPAPGPGGGGALIAVDTPTLNLDLFANTLSGAVRVSADAGNALQSRADGLFVAAGPGGGQPPAGQPVTQDVPAGQTPTVTIQHNLARRPVPVAVMELATGDQVHTGVNYSNDNSVTLTFGSAPTAGQYRVSIG